MSSIKILHGNYKNVIKGVKADLIFTSPPYNIGSKGKRKDGQRRFGLYDAKSYGAIHDYPDNLPEEEYQKQQVSFLKWCVKHLSPNGTLVYNHKPRRQNNRVIHPMEWFIKVPELTLMEEIIWDRGSTHNHCNKLLWPHTERLYVFRLTNGNYSFKNEKSLEFRSDVWKIMRSNGNGHNAPFPLSLAKAVINTWSKEGDLVIDPYCGSGTSAVASKELKRNFIGSEILKKYHKLATNRLNESC